MKMLIRVIQLFYRPEEFESSRAVELAVKSENCAGALVDERGQWHNPMVMQLWL